MSDPKITEKPPTLSIVGATGLKQYGGRLDEELHKELRGTKAVKVFRQMADNSAGIGAALYVIDMFARQVEWLVEPSKHPRAKGSSEAVAIAERVQGGLHDMRTSWPETVGEIMTMLIFGWCYLEMLWKICRGEGEDPLFASTYDDGLIMPRDWPIRAQESLDRWEFDDSGNLLGMWQMPPPDYRPRYIPLSKALLFRTRAHKGNPEGWSMLRPGYRNWFFMTRMEEFEGIGAEKETAGMHKMEVPMDVFMNPEFSSAKASWQEFVSRIRQDGYGGVVVPTEQDADGKYTGFRLSRLTNAGRNAADLDTPIRRHGHLMLMSFAMGWLSLGDGVNGSKSLAETLTSMGARALNGLLQVVDGVVTRDAFPQIMQLNGFDPCLTPRLCHKEVEESDVTQLVDSLTKLSGAGIWVPRDKDHAWLREKLGAPAEDDAELGDLEAAQRSGVAQSSDGSITPG